MSQPKRKKQMRIKIIACGVFKPYIEYLLKSTTNTVDVTYMDAGLHETPNILREKLQAEITKVSKKVAGHNYGDCKNCPNPCIKFDYIVVFYGLCGRGTLDIETFDVPVIFPKAHDCISLFLGSAERYRKEFKAHPGTFYHTAGWITEKINPRNKEVGDLYKNYYEEGFASHPEFDDLSDKYGSENAEFILKFQSHWMKNYTRSAYIDFGLPFDEELSKLPKYMAQVFGWEYARLESSFDYIKSLFNAENTPQSVLIPCHSKTVFSQDNIFSYVKEGDTGEFYEEETVLKEINNPITQGTFGLGIDAGGTYTDGVIYDFKEQKVLATAKAPTTYEDLLIGIREVLEALPKEELSKVAVTSLSTTLATNAMVEGRGYKVGLISYSPFDWFDEQVSSEPMVKVKGAISIEGEIIEPIDKDEILKASYDLTEQGCKAIAVGGYASIRNPKLSEEIREIIHEQYPNILVVCSHDLSDKLNAVNSLRTAVSNARLVPVIEELINSVKRALKDFGLPEKLLVVKGDGSNIDSSAALRCPIETIMSGPAASALGALVLSKKKDAFVMDIGGTTTDCAIIENGQVDISDEGATVGNWTMNVDCAKISTTGLGGDSRISFGRERKIILGPRRSLPYAFICYKYPYLLEKFKELSKVRLNSSENADMLDILILQTQNINEPPLGRLRGATATRGGAVGDYSETEQAIINALQEGPLFVTDLMERLSFPSIEFLHVDRLEQKGIIKRASLTPTDIMRIEGDFSKWSLEASKYGLSLFSALFGKSEQEVIDLVYKEINRRCLEEIILRHLNDKIGKAKLHREDYYFIDKILDENHKGLSLNYNLSYPIIGIGAPTETMLKNLRKYIYGEVIIPEYANVANAVGAISGQVVVRENAIIKVGEETNYKIFTRNLQDYATDLEEATDKAIALLEKLATEKAKLSGAISPSLKIVAKDKVSRTADGAFLFIERNIRCEAKGSAVI